MKSHLFVSFGALLLALGALATACGDGAEALTLEEYFQRLAADNEQFDARFDEIFEREPPGPDASGKELADFERKSTQDQVALLADILDFLRDIDPPEEVKDEHEEWLAANEALRQAIQDFAEAIPESPSREEAEDLLFSGNPGFEEAHEPIFAAGERATNACLAVQAIADQNNIQVDNVAADLECEEEEEG